MKTQDELRAEYDRLFEAVEYEAAGKILDLIEPISREVWLKILRDAPLDDEPVSPAQRKRLDEAHAALERVASQRVS